MGTESEELTEYLLERGYVHCDDCKAVLPKIDLIEHYENVHRKIHHFSDTDQGK